MTLLTRKVAITMSVALVAVGGLVGCADDEPANPASPTPTESSMMSEEPSEDSMMSEEPSDDSMVGEEPSEDSMMEDGAQ